MLTRRVLMTVTAALGLGALAVPVRAQVSAGVADSALTAVNAGVADSLIAFTPRYLFSPTYTNRITGDVSSLGMANELRTSFRMPWRTLFNFQLSGDKKNYRLQNRLEDNKRMSASLSQTFRRDVTGTVTYADNRVFNRSIAVGGGVQDFIVNDLSLSSNVGYLERFGDVRMDAIVKGSVVNGERAFKTDQTLAGGVFGGVALDALNHHLWLEGRTGTGGSDQRSSTADSTFHGLGASEDSLMTRARIVVSDSISFSADYLDYHADRVFTDQARGSLGGQLEGAENVFEETEFHDVRNTTLTMTSRLPLKFGLNLSANHAEDVFDYAIQKERFSNTTSDGFTGSVDYRLPWKSTATVSFEGNSTLRDLGPQSVSSLTDKRKLVRLGISHQFTPTLNVDLNGSTQLLQSFYLDYEANPRDRDQVDTSVNLRLSSKPFEPILATINVAYSGSEFINIDASQSADNRTRSLWEFRPGFTYTMNQWLTIVQSYGLAIEFTDYQYKSTDNYLDRNITFTNLFVFNPMRDVAFKFEYALYLHDTGSYLPDPVTGQDVLGVQSEDRRDRTNIRVDYRVNQRVKVFGENLYSRFENRFLASDTKTVTTDGQVKVGTTGDYDWGHGRKLSFTLARVKRFSPFGAEAEKNYWDARSEFSYPF
jgi:hypothetical protein